jgi:hypothetical protein
MRKIFIKATAFLFVIGLFALARWSAEAQTATSQSSQTPAPRRERSIRTENHSWNWRHNDDDKRLEVTIRGRVEFADDYSDIKSMSDDGFIRVIDENGGSSRKFEASSTAGGIQRSYWLNGQSQAIDQDVRAWLAKVLNDTVRQGGYDARPRVQRILKESGPTGVLREISQLKSDYVKRIYFDELIKVGNLDDQTVRHVLRQAATEIRSDYEKAQLLVKMSEDYLVNDNQRAIYIEGVSTIHSDYEKGRALGALLKKGNLSRENMLFTLRAVSHIKSDYERAQLLIKIATGFPLDESSRTAYLEALETLRSDYEKGRALTAFMKKGELQKEELTFVIKSASGISSDYEKAQVLIKVAAAGSRDETVRNALIDSARTIRSEYERGRVLSAVFK